MRTCYEQDLFAFGFRGYVGPKAHAGFSSGPAAPDSATSAGINTTTCNLAIIAAADASGVALTPSDSKGNSWNTLTTYQTGVSGQLTLFYSFLTSVGSGHTFTVTGTGGYSGATVAVFHGPDVSVKDQATGHGLGSSAAAPTIQPGSVTPGQFDELLISAIGYSFDTWTVDSGYTITDAVPLVGGQNYGCSMAYRVQSGKAASNPTWTGTGITTEVAAAIVTFYVPTAFTTGTLLVSSHTATTVTLSLTSATLGTRPYTYKLQSSPDDGSNNPTGVWTDRKTLTGQSDASSPSATLTATGLSGSTKYWFRVVQTDSTGSTAQTATTSSVSQTTDSGVNLVSLERGTRGLNRGICVGVG